MRLYIDIRVKVPDKDLREQRLKFVESVMKYFRDAFPEAEPIVGIDEPSPVTVSFWNDDGTPMHLGPKSDPDTDVSINV